MIRTAAPAKIKKVSAFCLIPLKDIHEMATRLAVKKTKYVLAKTCLKLLLCAASPKRSMNEKYIKK